MKHASHNARIHGPFLEESITKMCMFVLLIVSSNTEIMPVLFDTISNANKMFTQVIKESRKLFCVCGQKCVFGGMLAVNIETY